MPSLALESMNSHVSPSLALDAKLGFYVPLFEFICSWAHFSAAGKEREQRAPSTEGVRVTADKDLLTSWASVSEAYLMMTLVA